MYDTSKTIVINGPCKLNGEVFLQGAKNSAMKHVLLPLIADGEYVLQNIPRNTSILSLIELVKVYGVQVEWTKENEVRMISQLLNNNQIIPADIFYHTSGGVLAIPIIASRFGACRVAVGARDDTGGDLIGRKIGSVIDNLKNVGIEYGVRDDIASFTKSSDRPFEFTIPNRSFGATVIALYAGLFKDGVSQIITPTQVAEFDDVLDAIEAMGAGITYKNDTLIVNGGRSLKAITYKNMYDKNDFATWLFMALATKSDIKIVNVDYRKMKLDAFQSLFDLCDGHVTFCDNWCQVDGSQINLSNLDITAGLYPYFDTDAQPLISVLLTQLNGASTIRETLYPNRLQYWTELAKFGAKYEYFSDSGLPEENGWPRAVKVFGPTKLTCAEVVATDVRAGAAMVIAGLVAEGKTVVSGVEHIERGYENFVERLKLLGARVTYGE